MRQPLVFPFSEQALLGEVEDVVRGLTAALEAVVYGERTVRTLMGLPGGTSEVWRKGRELDDLPVPEAMEQMYERLVTTLPASIEQEVSVRGLPITFNLRALYDYVINTRWPDGLELDRFLVEAETYCRLGRTTAELLNRNDVPHRAEAIVWRAKARAKLDSLSGRTETGIWGEPLLTIPDMGYLGGMTERGVRNAALLDDEKGLRTVRQGNRAFIEHEEALRWLRGRRGFRETQFYELEARRRFQESQPGLQDVFQRRQF